MFVSKYNHLHNLRWLYYNIDKLTCQAYFSGYSGLVQSLYLPPAAAVRGGRSEGTSRSAKGQPPLGTLPGRLMFPFLHQP